MARYRGTMRVLLASTSPARRALLRQAGIEPLTMAPEVDEDAVIHAVEAAEGRTLPPDEHVLLLARRKALDVVARLALEDADFDGLVIGGDSMFELDGLVLGKPHEPAIATERWHAMRGRTGILHSGHSVYRVIPGRTPVEAHAVAHASVTFVEDVTDAEIEAYVTDKEEKRKMRARADAYIRAHGAAPNDGPSLCVLGRDEIAKQSRIGALLRAR